MTRCGVAVLAALALLGCAMPAATAHAAGPPATVCSGREILRVTPGLSLTAGTSGSIRRAADQGTEECTGPVDGLSPTGGLRTAHSVLYGSLRPDTCTGIEASGAAIHSVPTPAGTVDLVNHFTATFHPLSDGVMSGSFSGDRLSGRFWLRPVEGDCVTSPLSVFEGMWIGTWHDTPRSG